MAIAELKDRRTAGSDAIPSFLVRDYRTDLINPFTRFFSLVLIHKQY